ncbi:MAG: AAA family ATPase [Xenococcaceae cyanobacterium]
MIRSLHLINFKLFENQFLELKSLTLLSGLNSTGKSSVLQSLLLLRQSYQQDFTSTGNKDSELTGLSLNGDWIDIGTAQDAFCERAREDYIGFELIWGNNQKMLWHFQYDLKKKDTDFLESKIDNCSSKIYYESSIFSQKFHYLQAERVGPRPFNKMSENRVRVLGQIGTRGEYTAHFLAINESKNIPIDKLNHPKAKSLELRHQVEAWIREVSPGTRIKITLNSNMGLTNSQYFYGDSKPYRATNVGFGISYTLPIIVAILASEPGTLILLENPEAHLHPKGQAKMGELLALAASCGVQIVVETHSDHVLNGIRLAVHDGKINPEDVQLHYFQRIEKEGQLVSEVVSPHINRNGRIDQWPDGFFDEWDKSLEALLEPITE